VTGPGTGIAGEIMSRIPLLRAEDTVLLLIDLQERLARAMPASAWETTRDTTVLLGHAAGLLDLPVLVTRQYPQGLGDTVPGITEALPGGSAVIDKTAFSAADDTGIMQALEMTGRAQVLVCGMETHVCVLQTVAGLQRAGYAPFVVAGATCSRTPEHRHDALERMHAGGAVITNHESALFEALRDARHERFRDVSRLLK